MVDIEVTSQLYYIHSSSEVEPVPKKAFLPKGRSHDANAILKKNCIRKEDLTARRTSIHTFDMAVIWGLDLHEMQWSKFRSSYMFNRIYHLRRCKMIVYQLAMILCVCSESVGTAALSGQFLAFFFRVRYSYVHDTDCFFSRRQITWTSKRLYKI